MDLNSPDPGLSSGAQPPSVEEFDDFKSFVSEGSAGLTVAASPALSFGPGALPDPERVNAAIVIALTLACTALAVFDLFLLALGS